MTTLATLLQRNSAFVQDRPASAGTMPTDLVYVICCVDPRVEPAAVFGVGLGDALVQRNPGGRVTDEVVEDVALLAFMGEFMGVGTGTLDVAVVHHAQCGMGLLGTPEFAEAYARRAGVPLADAQARAVTDPAVTVRSDVEKLAGSRRLPAFVRVSGHVLELESGQVRTVVPAVAAVSA